MELLEVESPLAPPDTKIEQECRVVVTKREGMKLGLNVDYGDGVNLRVTKVKPGLIQEWNENRKPGEQTVELGDLITTINGSKGGASELLDLITTQASLDMIVIRRK